MFALKQFLEGGQPLVDTLGTRRQAEVLQEWLQERGTEVYIKLNAEYAGCPNIATWVPGLNAQN